VGQDVGEVEVALVGKLRTHLDGSVVGVRDPQELGLPARNRIRTARRSRRGSRPVALFADLGRLALGLEPAAAHGAVPQEMLKGNHDAVAGNQVRHRAADLLDDAHRFVAQDVPAL
jgi:hypothetical protein